MKIYISADMEGISGVVHWEEQTFKEGHDYQRFRKLMTEEVNAAAAGFFEAGAEKVVVNDAHGSMKNLLIEKLDKRVRLISGSTKPLAMMEGIDDTFDAAAFVGYHSRVGTHGVLNHTHTGSLAGFQVNGKTVGEIGMSAFMAGHFQVPVVLVTGCTGATEEAAKLLPNVRTAAVKRYVGRFAADNVHPSRAREEIKKAASRAVEAIPVVEPLVADSPVTTCLTFMSTKQADEAELMPDVERTGPLNVEYTAQDYRQALLACRAMIKLGGGLT